MRKTSFLFILLVLAGAILVAGCTQQPAVTPAPATQTPSADSIRITTHAQYGQMLVDANGRTLYYFATDKPGTGNSTCYGQCIVTWPAFPAAPITVSPPLKTADFGEITRTDGTKQTTYMGWPLYYFASDAAPGDVKGQGIKGIWFVISPSGVITLAPTLTPSLTTAAPTTVPTATKTTTQSSSSYSGGY